MEGKFLISADALINNEVGCTIVDLRDRLCPIRMYGARLFPAVLPNVLPMYVCIYGRMYVARTRSEINSELIQLAR